ncbi:MAG: F0F1 ATP synthase subunit B' [Paracoccaceae bacterium]|nr:F0F1 ATP synthase subunit B' [Paracoccaceae bacterium]
MAVETGTVDSSVQHAEGMPQLDVSTFPNQIFWLVVTLVVIYLILSRIAIPRIREILAERSRTIEQDIETAASVRAKAVECEQAYEAALDKARSRAREIVAEARAGIAGELETATEDADRRIAAKLAESEERIGEIRADALRSIEMVATDVADDIVRAVMPSIHDSGAVRAAVAARIADTGGA